MKRSKHSLSNYKLLTCEMGKLVPVGIQEVLPGDTFNHQTSALIRVSPLVAPVMHPVQVRIHHFYVPNRIMWDGWEEFITGGKDGTNSDTPPRILIPTDSIGRISDYMGISPPADSSIAVNALPMRAYNKIFNEFYRDEDLVAERHQDDNTLANIAWSKDYFTTARPWPQKGPAVTIPLGERAPVTGIGIEASGTSDSTNKSVWETGKDQLSTYDHAFAASSTSKHLYAEKDPTASGRPNIYADLSAAEAVSITDFRKAFALQRYQEARAMYGSRYSEYLRYIGVRSSDARLQKPEYLGGGKQTISFSEVLQTTDDAEGSHARPLGSMAGHGIAALRSNRYRRYFEEHGFVISLMSVRPRSIYSDGLNRLWSREDKEDYYTKELEQIGQQEIYNRELFANGTNEDDTVFGYQDRYAEYKHTPSTIAGDFRDTLNYWHMSREFTSHPTLNESFIECNPTKRIYAASDEDALWCMVNHSLQARRMVSKTAHSRIL